MDTATANQALPIADTWLGMKTFSGEDRQNINDFLNIFDLNARGYGWTPEQKAQKLPMLLRGYALQCFKGLTHAQQTNYDTLLTQLKERLTPMEQESFYQQALVDRKQRSGESVAVFASQIRKLVNGAYKDRLDNDDALESLMLSYFLMRLHPEFQERVRMEKPTTMREAEDAARRVEAQRNLLNEQLIQSTPPPPVFAVAEKQQPTMSCAKPWRH